MVEIQEIVLPFLLRKCPENHGILLVLILPGVKPFFAG